MTTLPAPRPGLPRRPVTARQLLSIYSLTLTAAGRLRRAAFCNVVRALLGLAVLALVAWPTGTRAQASSLVLVYLDSANPGVSDVWVSFVDGASRRLVATLPAAARALALRGSTLLLATEQDLVSVDLTNGTLRRTGLGGRVASGYLTENGTAFFTTRRGCGPAEAKMLLGRIDGTTGVQTNIAELELPGAEILWHDPATADLVVLPRGCDPGIAELRLLDGKTGLEKARVAVQGCGWARLSPNGQQALVSYAYCSGPNNPELTVIDFQDAGRRELRFAKDGPSAHPFVYSPDGARAAYGLALARGNPGGIAASGGIWLLDPSSLASTKLWQDPGLESWAIDWSPDGSALVIASVLAQGACDYYVVDVATGAATSVSGINGCGVNGTLVGFATLP